MKSRFKRFGAVSLCAVLVLQLSAAAFAEEPVLTDSFEEAAAGETEALPEISSEEPELIEGEAEAGAEIISDTEGIYTEEISYDTEPSVDEGELAVSEELMVEAEDGSGEKDIVSETEDSDEPDISSEWVILETEENRADEVPEDADEETLTEDILLEDDQEEILESMEETDLAEVSLDIAEVGAAFDKSYTLEEGTSASVSLSDNTGKDLKIRCDESTVVTATLTPGEKDAEGNVNYTVRFTGGKPGVGYVYVYWEDESGTHNVITYRITVGQKIYLALGEAEPWKESISAADASEVRAVSADSSVAEINASLDSGTVTSTITAKTTGTVWLSILYKPASGTESYLKRYIVRIAEKKELSLRETTSKSYRFSSSSMPDVHIKDYDESIISGKTSITGPDSGGKYSVILTLTGKSVGETTVYLFNGTKLVNIYHVKVTERFPDPKITVSPDSLKLFTEGKNTEQITASGLIEDDEVVSWTSDKPAVAAVDQSGLVTAKGAGSAKITVTLLSGLKKDIPVTVIKPVISVSVDSSSLKIGEKEKINVTYASGDKAVSFTSGDPSILSVDEDGNITAIKPGSTSVTVKLESGITGSVKVKVVLDAPVMKACYNSAKGIQVTWKRASGAESYEIYRTNQGKKVKIATVGKDDTSYLDSSVKNKCWGRVYVYYVRAKSGSAASGQSAGFVIQRLAPMKISSCRSTSKKTATVKWEISSGNKNIAAGYELQYARSTADLYGRKGTFKKVGGLNTRKSLSKKITGLKSGKTYYFRVRAYSYYTNSVTGKRTKTWSQFSKVRAVKIK